MGNLRLREVKLVTQDHWARNYKARQAAWCLLIQATWPHRVPTLCVAGLTYSTQGMGTVNTAVTACSRWRLWCGCCCYLSGSIHCPWHRELKNQSRLQLLLQRLVTKAQRIWWCVACALSPGDAVVLEQETMTWVGLSTLCSWGHA